MSITEENKNWLTSRLPYELKMLRLAHLRMRQYEGHKPNLGYYLPLECFALHVRNLYTFLRSSNPDNEYLVRTFSPGYRWDEDNPDVLTLLERVTQQISRPFTRADEQPLSALEFQSATTIRNVLEQQFSRFVLQLSPEYSSEWQWESTNPYNVRPKRTIGVNRKGARRRRR